MVLAILVDTTLPIKVLRRPTEVALLVSVVSVMAYFVSVAACLVAAFFFFTGAAAFFPGAAAAALGAEAALPPANSFWRFTVWMRAMSFFSSRIFFRLSVCPIFN